MHARGRDGGAPQRWGIIGLGAQAVGIARALQSVDGVELVACSSTAPERVVEFADMFDCAPCASEQELFDSELDLVVVSGVNSDHARHCIGALQAGSDVLCEKPLALTRRDGEAILEAAAKHSRALYTGYHYRFRALSREIRDLVQSGAIGEVRDVHMQRTSEHLTESVRPWRHDLATAGAGVMCDVGVHLVDFVCWVTGQAVTSVGAVATPRRDTGRPDEHIVVSLELSGGALAVIDVARDLASADNSLQVHGSAGTVSTGPLRWVEQYRVELRQGRLEPSVLEAPANAPLRDEMIAVRDARLGVPSDLLADAAAGLAGAATLEAVIESLSSDRRVAVSGG